MDYTRGLTRRTKQPRLAEMLSGNLATIVPMAIRKWLEVTCEERFFTSVLFHDVLRYSEPLLDLLRSKLNFPPDVSVLDAGYEAEEARSQC